MVHYPHVSKKKTIVQSLTQPKDKKRRRKKKERFNRDVTERAGSSNGRDAKFSIVVPLENHPDRVTVGLPYSLPFVEASRDAGMSSRCHFHLKGKYFFA